MPAAADVRERARQACRIIRDRRKSMEGVEQAAPPRVLCSDHDGAILLCQLGNYCSGT